MSFLLVVIDDFNVRRTAGIGRPFKANAPLLVNANGPLPCPIAFECFQPIAGQSRQIGQRHGSVQNLEALPALPVEPLKRADELAICELLRAFASVTQYQAANRMKLTMYVKRLSSCIPEHEKTRHWRGPAEEAVMAA
jgi:hypothetical protein